jgi:hypothetical protein
MVNGQSSLNEDPKIRFLLLASDCEKIMRRLSCLKYICTKLRIVDIVDICVHIAVATYTEHRHPNIYFTEYYTKYTLQIQSVE